VLADGHGSDGALALEATEVSTTLQSRSLVAVWPPDPLAGLPNRSPIPLADAVTDGVAAAQAGVRQAGAAAGGVVGRLLRQAQELLPRRRTPFRRVTTLSARRDLQRRAAVAVLAFVVVFGGLGVGYWIYSGSGAGSRAISSANAGQLALDRARSNLERVFGATPASGINLVVNDPPRALQLLTDAHTQLAAADKAGIPAIVTGPLRTRVVGGLDSLYKMSEVHESLLFQVPDNDPPIDLRALVRGPDGAPYILDATTKAVYRINLQGKAATAVLKAGQKVAGGADAAEPKLLSTGGPDLLILDAANTLWRWRPADAKGKGTLARIRVSGSASWGQDIRGIGTYVRNASAGLYNLYVVDPSAQQILAYAPAADGSGFPAAPSGRLATARSIETMRSLFIDGDIFAIEHGRIERFVSGRTDGWDAVNPGDELLRKAPVYELIASGSDRRAGRLYAWDPGNLRIVAIDKVDGRFRAQYRLPAPSSDWADIRGMYVLPGVADQPDTLIWIHRNALFDTVLEAAVPVASPSPGPGGASPAAQAGSTARPPPP
jgi:hypothetical protein